MRFVLRRRVAQLDCSDGLPDDEPRFLGELRAEALAPVRTGLIERCLERRPVDRFFERCKLAVQRLALGALISSINYFQLQMNFSGSPWSRVDECCKVDAQQGGGNATSLDRERGDGGIGGAGGWRIATRLTTAIASLAFPNTWGHAAAVSPARPSEQQTSERRVSATPPGLGQTAQSPASGAIEMISTSPASGASLSVRNCQFGAIRRICADGWVGLSTCP